MFVAHTIDAKARAERCIKVVDAITAKPENKDIDFGIHARTGRVIATYEITGTLESPQVIEIPLTLPRGNMTRENRTLFIREKGSWDSRGRSAQTRRSREAHHNIVAPKDTPLCNAWLTLQHGIGVNVEHYGDSSGVLKKLIA